MSRLRIVRSHKGKRETIEITGVQARKLGLTGATPGPTSVAYLFEGILGWADASGDKGRICDSCGLSHRELILTHRVGCDVCYDTFGDTIERNVRISGSDAGYRGRLPRRLAKFKALVVERESYKLELDQAIKAEDFERAAAIRDLLRLADESRSAGGSPVDRTQPPDEADRGDSTQ